MDNSFNRGKPNSDKKNGNPPSTKQFQPPNSAVKAHRPEEPIKRIDTSAATGTTHIVSSDKDLYDLRRSSIRSAKGEISGSVSEVSHHTSPHVQPAFGFNAPFGGQNGDCSVASRSDSAAAQTQSAEPGAMDAEDHTSPAFAIEKSTASSLSPPTLKKKILSKTPLRSNSSVFTASENLGKESNLLDVTTCESIEYEPPVVTTTTPIEKKNGDLSSEDRRFKTIKKQQLVKEESNDVDEDEALFMPFPIREEYIPVRVAREKIKEVLSGMAQMKNKHIAAIEAMEKQHQSLKNQLERACADYAKKLTNDYNFRLNALDAEYCRRLVRLSKKTVRQEVDEQLMTARKDAKALEKQMEERLAEKEKLHEKTKVHLIDQLDLERKTRYALQGKLDKRESRVRELESIVLSLEKEIQNINGPMNHSKSKLSNINSQ
eukprot:Tbor_TRINITY_DN5099_c0_g1::TRINITY_DN5099_c0_g1_i1::g.14316::m.14316